MRASPRPVSFVRVSRARGSPGAQLACIALAGTLGAMGMLGHRRAGATEVFAAGGQQALAMLLPLPAAFAGILIHALWMVVWGFVLAALARLRPGRAGVLLAIGVAALAFVMTLLLPAPIVGPVATLTTGERALVHVVLGISLMIGMPLARPGDARADW